MSAPTTGSSAGVFDPLAGSSYAPPSGGSSKEDGRTDGRLSTPSEPMIRFWTPSELVAYQPPPNQNLVGDYHIQRGAISILAGPPGCGKSRAGLWLGLMGA